MCVASVPPILADVVLYSRRSGVAWLGMQAKNCRQANKLHGGEKHRPIDTITSLPETSLNADRLSKISLPDSAANS